MYSIVYINNVMYEVSGGTPQEIEKSALYNLDILPSWQMSPADK